jgi:gas vesicle protein
MAKKNRSAFGTLRKAVVGGALVKFLTSDHDKGKKESSGLMKKLVVGGILGAIAYLLFEPKKGAERRGKLLGLANRAKPRRSVDDAVLEARVESEVLTRHRYPKGQVTLEVVDGIVTLRGQLDTSEQISSLEQEVRKVTGVVEVRNFLHLPSEPAPNKEEALKAGS